MKTRKRTKLLSLTFAMTFMFNFSAQTFNSAVDYMNHIGEQYKQIVDDQWSYTSAVANDKSAKKIESKRQELINSNKKAQETIKKMPGYNGNTAYRDSVVSFLQLNYNVLKQDYEKIVDMEEVAEQSYDLMEAYLLAQEKASEKIKEASDMLSKEQEAFAKENDITLLEGEQSKKSKKLANASRMYKYYNKIYLIFFKCYKQEAYLLDALNKADVNAMEQNNNALAEYSEEGLAELKKMQAYDGDNSLMAAAVKMLEFYKNEASKEMPSIIDFFIKKDKFEKINEAFQAKKKNQRTQEDVDSYNKAVNDYNAATNAYNSANESLNGGRSKNLENWNNTAKKFTKKHV